MAKRPVYEVSLDERLFIRKDVEFTFFSGFSDKQQKKSVHSLHEAYAMKNEGKKVLEISRKSDSEIGIRASAFNLKIKTKEGNEYALEVVFQASKVFENGGPYIDLINMPPGKAKKDERLRKSGKITLFKFNGREFSAEPKTFFYNWLYINTLNLYPDLANQMCDYDAFTDIAFNPQKSLNCQAEAAAIYVSLYKQGILNEALRDVGKFKKIVYKTEEQIDFL